jgi:tetratricopeptide (TPR) repeat protein
LDIQVNINTFLMSKFLLIIALSVLVSCKSGSKVATVTESKANKGVVLSEEQQRKFDYFFYEAIKEKVIGNIERAANYYIECLKIDNASSASLYELANIYLMDKQTDKAIGLLERAVSLNPDNIWYSLLLAEVYQSAGNSSKAIEAYKNLVQRSNNEEYMFELALLFSKEKQYTEALGMLNDIEKKIGINEAVVLEKQRLYLEQGKGKEAIKELNTLIKAYPYEYRYLGYLGDVYLYLGQFDQAELTYNALLSKDSSFELVYFSLSNLYLQKSEMDKFLRFLMMGMASRNLPVDTKLQKLAPFMYNYKKEKALISGTEVDSIFNVLLDVNKDDQRIYHIYGQFLKEEGQSQKAYDIMKEGILIDENNESLWQDILFLNLDLNDSKQLLSDGKEAIKSNPSNPIFYLLLGSAYLQAGDAKEALNSVGKGLMYSSDNIALKGQFYALYGDSYYKDGKSDSAFFYYEEALKINSKNLGVLNNYAYYLSLEGKELGKAEQMSSKTVELDPLNSTYLDTYAWVLFKRGRFFEAKFIIERAIDNGGNSSGVIVEHYGDILFFNNDLDGALTQWNKALDLSPENSELLKRKIEEQKYLE